MNKYLALAVALPLLSACGGGGDAVQLEAEVLEEITTVNMGPTVATGGEIVRVTNWSYGRGLSITQKPDERPAFSYDPSSLSESGAFLIDLADVELNDGTNAEALIVAYPDVATTAMIEVGGFKEHYAFGIPFVNTLGTPNTLNDFVGTVQFSYDAVTEDFFRQHGYGNRGEVLPSSGLATGYIDLENAQVGMTILGQDQLAMLRQEPYARIRAQMTYQVATTGVMFVDSFEQFADEIGLMVVDDDGRQLYTTLQSTDLGDNLKSWGHLHGTYGEKFAGTGIVSGNGFDASWIAIVPE